MNWDRDMHTCYISQVVLGGWRDRPFVVHTLADCVEGCIATLPFSQTLLASNLDRREEPCLRATFHPQCMHTCGEMIV